MEHEYAILMEKARKLEQEYKQWKGKNWDTRTKLNFMMQNKCAL